MAYKIKRKTMQGYIPLSDKLEKYLDKQSKRKLKIVTNDYEIRTYPSERKVQLVKNGIPIKVFQGKNANAEAKEYMKIDSAIDKAYLSVGRTDLLTGKISKEK